MDLTNLPEDTSVPDARFEQPELDVDDSRNPVDSPSPTVAEVASTCSGYSSSSSASLLSSTPESPAHSDNDHDDIVDPFWHGSPIARLDWDWVWRAVDALGTA